MAIEKDSIHARFEAGQDVMQVCKETGMTMADAGWRYCVWINEGLSKQAQPCDAKWEAAIRDAHRHGDLGLLGIEKIIASIRARIIAPAKSAEERVTVCYRPDTLNGDPRPYKVLLDGKPAGECFGSHDPAQIYRLGLIATLKQEGK